MGLFAVAVVTALFLFGRHLDRLRQQSVEKRVFEEAGRCLEFLDRHLPLAQVNDLSGSVRMNFRGSPDTVRFIAPFSESEGSDLTKFAVARDGRNVVVQVVRVDSEHPGMELPGDLRGSQILCRDVERFNLQYFDGRQWVDRWETGEGDPQEAVLPQMVRVELVVSPEEAVEGRRQSRSFSRVIRLEAR